MKRMDVLIAATGIFVVVGLFAGFTARYGMDAAARATTQPAVLESLSAVPSRMPTLAVDADWESAPKF
jgi:hypothetical protein